MTEQEFNYDFERCTTIEERHEMIELFWREYDIKKAVHWPFVDYVDSFIIPEPWFCATGVDWQAYYDPCIVIPSDSETIYSDYDDGGL